MQTPNDNRKNIVAFVMSPYKSSVDTLKSYKTESGKSYRLMLIREPRTAKSALDDEFDIIIECDFNNSLKLSEALLPYQNQLAAITCRGEAFIAHFRKIIPHVPYLRTPTTESLKWATDKYEMRKRLNIYDPKHTPRFTRIVANTKDERKRVIEKVGFPLVVKPTNLAASLFVTICYHEEDLEKALRTIFRKIKKAYQNDKRLEEPKVIAEEFMDGQLYSVDTYINSRGETYHCPLVRVKTGRDIGHDDFFNYLQMTPTALKKETIAKAEEVADTAIHALGLRSVTAHTELMRVDDDWKVVEVGPRMGGFRDVLHGLSCDIDHPRNDVFIRIPKKPVIPKKCKGFAAYMKYFASKEGRIVEMKGIKKIETLDSLHSISVNKKVGDRATFARNGGRAVFTAVLYNAERSSLLADIRRVEQLIDVKVATTRNGISTNGNKAVEKSPVATDKKIKPTVTLKKSVPAKTSKATKKTAM